MKNFKENFNFITNIFILILLFFGGLSYADTNGIWQFANDTRPGVFGLDEGAGIGNNYTFINPVYFNLGLHINGFSTFTQLNGNLFYANNVTIASQLTLSGFNCGANSKLRTDPFGNVVCSQDNINDSVHNLATMKTAALNDFHNLGGIDRVNDGVYNLATMRTAALNDFHNLGGVDKDTWITTQTCGAGKILTSVGKNSSICVKDTLASVKDGITWAEVTGKPTPKPCKKGFYISSINFGSGKITCTAGVTSGGGGVTLDLVNGLHSSAQCTAVGGSVVTGGGAKMCRFNAASCGSGLTQYKSWSTTIPTTSWNTHLNCRKKHIWSNTAIGKCSVRALKSGSTKYKKTYVSYSTVTQVGCY